MQVLHGMKTDDPSYVMKIDAASGKTLWNVERPTIARQRIAGLVHHAGVIRAGGRTEIIIDRRRCRHRPRPGDGQGILARGHPESARDRNYRIVASPMIVGDIIIAPSRNNPMVALRPGGSGDVASSHVAWTFAQGPDVPTPVSDGKLLYVVRDNGVVFASTEDRPDGLWTGAPAVWNLQCVADPGRWQDLRHH